MDRLATETKVMICEHLDDRALAKLSRVNTSWNDAAVYVLYKRDARAGDFESEALMYAVWNGCQSRDSTTKQTALRIFERSLAFNFDVNTLFGYPLSYTTLLAYASSLDRPGNVEWLKRLVVKGASVLVDSREICIEEGMSGMGWLCPRSELHPKREMESPALRKVQRGTLQEIQYYSPLFHPMVRGQKHQCELLLNIKNINPRLASAAPLASGEPAFNVLHAVAMGPADDMQLAQKLASRFPSVINEEIPTTREPGATPLHVAILTLNEDVFTVLLDAGANVHAEMGPVRTSPLNLIIEQMRDMPDVRDRKTLKRFLEKLLDAGADVNRPFPVGKGYSPLMTFIDAMKAQLLWPKVMKDVGALLLKRGANTNFVGLDGRTPLRLLVDTIISDMSQRNLEEGANLFLKILIKSYGADPNLSLTGGQSTLLGHVMTQYKLRDKSLFQLLKNLSDSGARLLHTEADFHLGTWLTDTKLQRLYKMKPHEGHLSQWKVNQAYVDVFMKKKNTLVEIRLLSGELGPPQNIPELLWLAFEPSNYSADIVKELLKWKFDADWIHPVHSTCIISQLVKLAYNKKSTYTLNAAAGHCRLLTERGASVLHKDPAGQTPLDLVNMESRSTPTKPEVLEHTVYKCCLEEMKLVRKR